MIIGYPWLEMKELLDAKLENCICIMGKLCLEAQLKFRKGKETARLRVKQ